MRTFSDRLMDAVDEKQTVVCVGLDPRLDLIPEFLKQESVSRFGETFEAVAASYLAFNKGIIDAIKDKVALVKPQIAFYEAYGAPGVKAFEETVRYARNSGLIVIEDAKRNDVGSTAEAYSSGHIGEVGFWGCKMRVYDVDAITVSPYLGSDGVEPFLVDCRNHQKGIFVLVKTSNPSSGELQDLLHVVHHPRIKELLKNAADNGTAPLFSDKSQPVDAERIAVTPNYMSMALKVKVWGEDVLGERGYSSVGAVVGATYPSEARALRKIMPKTYFLVPGYGAQGGSAEDSMTCLNPDGYGAIISSSRGIDYAYRTEPFHHSHSEDAFDVAASEATSAMIDDISKAMKSANKYPW